jgi:hypothetical protein
MRNYFLIAIHLERVHMGVTPILATLQFY